MGLAIPAKEKAKAAKVEVVDKVPEPETAAEPKEETKPAKSRKTK